MTAQAIRAVPTVRAVERQRLATWLLPLGLFGLALLVRLWAAGEVPFPAIACCHERRNAPGASLYSADHGPKDHRKVA